MSLSKGATIGLSAGLPLIALIVLILLFLLVLLCLARRKRKQSEKAQQARPVVNENQPYLQQKGELEAEEKRKYELQAEERRYELPEENAIREMSSTDERAERSNARRPELRGEEHCRELGGSSDG